MRWPLQVTNSSLGLERHQDSIMHGDERVLEGPLSHLCYQNAPQIILLLEGSKVGHQLHGMQGFLLASGEVVDQGR